ncbi:MAG TPA: hypothetical protein VLG40_02320 [Candidatus Saccharimonas sp.]|nr:hypothetical protein [Candidatus Saccharimonas sp.]
MSANIAQHRVPVSMRKYDYIGWFVATGAFVASVIAFAVTLASGTMLAYSDAISHMEIARRVVAGSEPDLAQLGGVWLPLPHVLMLPFVWIDPLYQSGIADAIVSMAAFVLSCWLLYKIGKQLTASKLAGVAAAVVFGLNVNVLYMQSTPMTELLLFVTLLLVVYCLQLWVDRRRYVYLAGAGVAGIASALTRYESWIILAVLGVIAVVVAWQQSVTIHSMGARTRYARDRIIFFGGLLVISPLFWVVWNWALFGDAFAFQDGEYAKPSLWLSNHEPAIGNLALSAKVYTLAVLHNIPLPLVVMACVGVVLFVIKEMVIGRFAARSLIAPSLLVIVPFFIAALYTGQRPLHVMEVNQDLYNTRFGLIVILPVAIFAGYLVSYFKYTVLRSVVCTAVVVATLVTSGLWLQSGDIVALRDPQLALASSNDTDEFAAADFLKAHYDSGDILMEGFGNERITFALPSQHEIYEGTNNANRWNLSLAHPAAHNIKWVVTRCNPQSSDKVCKQIVAHPDTVDGFTLVYNQRNYRVYKLTNG